MVLRLDIVVRVITKNVQNQLTGANRGLLSLANTAKFAAAAMAALAAVKLGRFVQESTRVFATFENEIRRATAVSVENLNSAEELNQTYAALQDRARQLGLTTVFTATEAAQGMFFLGQAGLNTREILEGIKPVLDLAQIGAISLAQSAEIATDIMAGMALEVEDLTRVVDVMTAAFTSSNQTVTELGTAFSKAGPFARLLGIELEEVAAALSVLANAGIKGTEGGAALRNVFLRLLNPTADNAQLLTTLGLSAEMVGSGMLSLQDILFRIKDAVDSGNLSVAGLAEIFQVRATTAVAAFVASLDDSERGLVGMEEKMRDAEGTATSMTDYINESTFFAFEQLKATIEELKIGLGEELAPTVMEIINSFRAHRKETAAVLAVIGDLIEGGFNVLTIVIEGAKDALTFFINLLPGGTKNLEAFGKLILDLIDALKPLLPALKLIVVIAFSMIGVFLAAAAAIGFLAQKFPNATKNAILFAKFLASIIGLGAQVLIGLGKVIAGVESFDEAVIQPFRDWWELLKNIKDEFTTIGEKIEGTRIGEILEPLPGFQAGGSFKVRRTGPVMMHQGEEAVVVNRNAGQEPGQFGLRENGGQVTINNTFNVANPDPLLMRRATDKYLRDMRRR